jgi:hypothetical protein
MVVGPDEMHVPLVALRPIGWVIEMQVRWNGD